jgi:hypothetical protein
MGTIWASAKFCILIKTREAAHTGIPRPRFSALCQLNPGPWVSAAVLRRRDEVQPKAGSGLAERASTRVLGRSPAHDFDSDLCVA